MPFTVRGLLAGPGFGPARMLLLPGIMLVWKPLFWAIEIAGHP
jgi:hypothetical protein